MSGGTWENISALVNNNNSNLILHGQSLLDQVQNGKSSKYVTVYPYDLSVDKDGANIDTASAANWRTNTRIYGDGVRETSTGGTGNTSWYQDFSIFPGANFPLFIRGGCIWNLEGTGIFNFAYNDGYGYFIGGFRSVLVTQ